VSAERVRTLLDRVEALRAGERYLLGVTGCPAAGKSTFAEALVRRVYPLAAIVVPMDGFHLSDETLVRMGLLRLKGTPETFDARGFVDLVAQLRSPSDRDILCPRFDRSAERSIEGGIKVEPKHRLCVVEGNYLLHPEPPWIELRRLLDAVWFLEVDEDTMFHRLEARHRAGGRSEEAARAKIESTDLPNAKLILSTSSLADERIESGWMR
jgi:pantothenate kinase